LLGITNLRSMMPLVVGGAVLILVGELAPWTRAVIGESGLVVWSGAVVLYAARQATGVVGGVLASRPLTYLGTISYGIYVFHVLVPETVAIVEHDFNIWLRFPPLGISRMFYMAVA